MSIICRLGADKGITRSDRAYQTKVKTLLDPLSSADGGDVYYPCQDYEVCGHENILNIRNGIYQGRQEDTATNK
jgi:hypothetical protein